MTMAAVMAYLQESLDGLTWPFSGVAGLVAYVIPPSPVVQSSVPAAYVWAGKFREARDGSRLRAGTVPRSAAPGGASGEKAVQYTLPVYLVWEGPGSDPADPQAANVFPGMVEGVCAALRGSAPAPGPDGQVLNPKKLTDPWDAGNQSWLIDLGEDMRVDTFFRPLDDDSTAYRFDAVIQCEITEVIAA